MKELLKKRLVMQVVDPLMTFGMIPIVPNIIIREKKI